METTRQALVAVKNSHDGPWQHSRGHEKAIKITNLGMGEVITLERDGDSPITFLQDGTYPFPKSKRFRFLKQASLFDSKETFVEIVL